MLIEILGQSVHHGFWQPIHTVSIAWVIDAHGHFTAGLEGMHTRRIEFEAQEMNGRRTLGIAALEIVVGNRKRTFSASGL